MNTAAESLPYLRAILVVAAFSVFLRQMFGAKATFKLPEKKKRVSAPILIMLGANAFVLYLACVAPLRPYLTIAGLVGLIASFALFEWARRSIRGRTFTVFFTDDTPQFLWTGGPYAYVRNSFYSSYILAYASLAIALRSAAAVVVLAVMIAFYFAAALREERKFARSALATDYTAYKRRTGRFLPRLYARSKHSDAA